MLPEVAYERYQELGGKLGEDAFKASLRAAMASVRQIIGFNVPDDANMEAYERAVCAAVDVDAYYGASGGVGEHMVSASLGSFSASFGSNVQGSIEAPSPYDQDMRRVIRQELTGSGLLYQGIG